jgi:hypothetical protein
MNLPNQRFAQNADKISTERKCICSGALAAIFSKFRADHFIRQRQPDAYNTPPIRTPPSGLKTLGQINHLKGEFIPAHWEAN